MKIKICNECGGEIKPMIEFFFDKDGGRTRLDKMQKEFKKKFKIELPDITSYNCIECGKCWDENFAEGRFKIAWAGKNGIY